MILETINEIKRGALIIPGGWQAHVIQVQANDADFKVLVDNLMHACNMSPEEAIKNALLMVQARFAAGWIHNLRMSIIGYAEKYLRLYPDMAFEREDGLIEARGFKPEVMQYYYLPVIGTRVEGSVDHVLQQMYEEAN